MSAIAPRSNKRTRIAGLRANSLAAVVMLVIEFALGVVVNLYTTLPSSDAGKTLFSAFGAAVTNGPVALTLHALLGNIAADHRHLRGCARGFVARRSVDHDHRCRLGGNPSRVAVGNSICRRLRKWRVTRHGPGHWSCHHLLRDDSLCCNRAGRYLNPGTMIRHATEGLEIARVAVKSSTSGEHGASTTPSTADLSNDGRHRQRPRDLETVRLLRESVWLGTASLLRDDLPPGHACGEGKFGRRIRADRRRSEGGREISR